MPVLRRKRKRKTTEPRSNKSSAQSNKTLNSNNAQEENQSTWDVQIRIRKANAPIERLPLEILVQIFIESMEISLPQSSHYIGKALSSDWVIRKFLSTIQFLEMVEVNRFMNCRFFGSEWWAKDNNGEEFMQKVFSDQDPMSTSTDWGRMRPPLKLIRGPWTVNKFNMWDDLEGMGKITMFDPQDPLGAQIALKCLEEAVAGCNSEAVERLLRVQHEMSLDQVVREATTCPIYNILSVPHYIVRDAVIKYGCVEEIVGLLLLHGLHSCLRRGMPHLGQAIRLGVDYTDPELWSWTVNNGQKGKWLLAMLKLMNAALVPATVPLNKPYYWLPDLWKKEFPYVEEDEDGMPTLQDFKLREVRAHWLDCFWHCPALWHTRLFLGN